jgi:hypothetical protein
MPLACVSASASPDIRLDRQVDQAARDALEDRVFGKRFLITDHRDWTIGEVVAGYRSQSEAEFGFRRSKIPRAAWGASNRRRVEAQLSP